MNTLCFFSVHGVDGACNSNVQYEVSWLARLTNVRESYLAKFKVNAEPELRTFVDVTLRKVVSAMDEALNYIIDLGKHITPICVPLNQAIWLRGNPSAHCTPASHCTPISIYAHPTAACVSAL